MLCGLLQEVWRRLLQLDLFGCDAAISACEKGIQWEIAFSCLRKMFLRSIQPDVIGCSAVIGACEKGAKWQAGLGLLQEMPRRLV